MTTYSLIEEVKKQGIYKTDNQIADALGVNRANISMWKKRGTIPNGEITLLLAELANKTPSEAYRILRNGFVDLSLLIVTGGVMGLISIGFFIVKFSLYTLCEVKSNLRGFTNKTVFK
jgi:transcriptional regulator with XRE-family HTH domain